MDGHGRNADLLHGGRRRRRGPTIRVNVLDADERLCLLVPAHTTFGELKMHIDQETLLEPDRQRLLFEEMERDDQEYLDMVGVNDNANVFLVEKKKKRTFEEGEGSRLSSAAEVRSEKELGSVEVPVEDPLEKENRLKALTSCAAVAKVRAEDDKLSEQSGSVEVPVEEPLEKENRLKEFTSCAAVAKVRAEDDKLSEQVAALKGVVNGGTQAGEKEISKLTELLTGQLLKLDGIKDVGEGKEQQKLEVVRIHSILNTLDSLKGMNSNPLGNDSRNV
ncbi:BAG family molecular chaperone regulator 4-like [Rhododendron vialii]|uniref:BAG family molecular chaperone regulator 4-like n=1 Tax=Rhododendron vialii TaxID=182163 RepID=UPI00265F8DDA|nr:BAG family molecular chaperone regulator 4-like [Rhododendron vialii]